MADASYAISSFLGGEISQYAQGRFDRPDYKISLKVCLNSFPVEAGSWTRRPGTQYGGHTRAGNKGRTIRFDFEQASPITMEFTDGFLRFRSGATLITTNDVQTVVAISTANPAVVQTLTAHGWSTGNTVMLPGASTPLLENRQFTIAVVDATHFSLQDALSGVNIDGSTLGAIVANTTVARVHELQTVYTGGTWANVRAVQAETTDILLNGTLPPQALTVPTLPTTGVNPVFAITPAIFQDGPYLDPLTNGAQLVPSGSSGIIQLTLQFPQYSSTQAYSLGSFVTSSGVNYRSLIDQNVNNTPASSPSAWVATSGNDAINNGKGFLGTDVGRLIRMLSEPPVWASGTGYNLNDVVSYNPSGLPNAAVYYVSLTGTGNTNKPPNSSPAFWSVVVTAGQWTWGKITSLANVISASSGAVIGNMTQGGGLAAAFDGIFAQASGSSAALQSNGTVVANTTVLTVSTFVGKNYASSGGQRIASATVYPATDIGLGGGSVQWTNVTHHSAPFAPVFTVNLRGKGTLPANSADGNLLGSATVAVNGVTPVILTSSDPTTAYNFVWIELIAKFEILTDGPSSDSYNFTNSIAEVQFFNPVASSGAAAVNVEILGSAMPYTNALVTWRLGAYSNTTGWPTCGCYDSGRLFLGGAISNRWDACYANGINGATVNFAPTDQYGTVTAAHAISFTFNSDSVNPIYWMVPDLQGIIMGAQSGEWLTQAPTNGPLSPTNASSRRVTKIGSSFVEPCRAEHTNLFVKRYGRKLMEYFPDVFSGKYTAPNLADRAQHIPRTGILELAYTEAVTPIVWGRCTDLSFFGMTYKRDTLTTSQGPTFYGWHRHALGTGRGVESICSGPSVGGNLDTLTMVTNDTSTNIRHVELLTDTPDELTSLTSSWYLDDAVNPTSASTSSTGLTLNGIWHLNGKTVQVFAGGLDCGDLGDLLPTWQLNKTYAVNAQVTGLDGNWYTALKQNININPQTDTGGNWQLGGTDFLVTNGSVFVPYGDGISAGPGRGLFTASFASGLLLTQFVIGMTYNSDGQAVRPIAPQDTGARNGPAFGKIERGHRYAMLLVNSLALKVGTDLTKLTPANFKQADGVTAWPKNQLFSGLHYETLNDNYSHTRSLCWRISRPFPTTIAAAGPNLATQDQ